MISKILQLIEFSKVFWYFRTSTKFKLRGLQVVTLDLDNFDQIYQRKTRQLKLMSWNILTHSRRWVKSVITLLNIYPILQLCNSLWSVELKRAAIGFITKSRSDCHQHESDGNRELRHLPLWEILSTWEFSSVRIAIVNVFQLMQTHLKWLNFLPQSGKMCWSHIWISWLKNGKQVWSSWITRLDILVHSCLVVEIFQIEIHRFCRQCCRLQSWTLLKHEF